MGTEESPTEGVLGIDETSADMLKNTPSNIRRLADEIQQYEGRQKYLAHTISPSDGGDVRWYFCKVPLGINQLAPSIPQTVIVGKGDYFRFGMRDSLAIEASFLQREEELLTYWWKEYAECSAGPKRTSESPAESSEQISKKPEFLAAEEERVGVPVKGGLYEVDLLKRHSFPVYWNGENRRVLRGHWFAQSGGLNWLPVREDVSEQLEFAYCRQVWHRRTFQPSGLFAARVDMQGSTPGLHALFTGEDDTWEALLNVDASGFSSVINFGGNGIKLRRGYAPSQSLKPTQDELRQQKEEEMDDYCSEVPVRHLVFMVHGIGQRLQKSNLVDDVTNFRHMTSSLAKKHLTSNQRGTQRVLYIPCQWRKGLKLSSESAVEKITLDGVRGLRTMLSATVHDVLYYMSPVHCQDIIDSVSNQLNMLYLKFLKRNPGYDGKVSIYGHSLGSVLSYDILCHQENLSVPFPMDCMYREQAGDNESSGESSKPSAETNVNSDGLDRTPHAVNEKKKKENEPSGNPCNLSSESNIKNERAKGMAYTVEENKLSGKLASLALDNDYCTDSLPLAREESCTDGLKEETSNDDYSSSVDCDESASSCSKAIPSGKKICEEGTSSHQDIDETSVEASDKDKEIMALKEKIAFLSARVEDFESNAFVEGKGASEIKDKRSISQGDATTSSSDHSHKPMRHKPYINYTKLEFKVDTFFAVGSPLGVFLALRNVHIGIGKGKEYWEEENIVEEMPGCRRMFNIFHPFDPVAYRVEPLICKEYNGKRPVIVPYHRGGKRLHIGLQDFTEDVAAHSQAIMNRMSSMRDKVLTVCQSRKEGLEDTEDNVNEMEKSYGSIMIEQLTGRDNGRVDHVLQDKTFQHAYISAIGSHTNYWRDHDTALFILKHLYEEIPRQFSASRQGDLISAANSIDPTDEQLPLISSEGSLFKRSIMKSRWGFRRAS
ncbi:hypothetical protein V2J09_015776 [Rumex salicifolius]